MCEGRSINPDEGCESVQQIQKHTSCCADGAHPFHQVVFELRLRAGTLLLHL